MEIVRTEVGTKEHFFGSYTLCPQKIVIDQFYMHVTKMVGTSKF